jgi:hypothetical protein
MLKRECVGENGNKKNTGWKNVEEQGDKKNVYN